MLLNKLWDLRIVHRNESYDNLLVENKRAGKRFSSCCSGKSTNNPSDIFFFSQNAFSANFSVYILICIWYQKDHYLFFLPCFWLNPAHKMSFVSYMYQLFSYFILYLIEMNEIIKIFLKFSIMFKRSFFNIYICYNILDKILNKY